VSRGSWCCARTASATWCSCCALEALRTAYPDAHLTLLGQAWHADLLRDCSAPVDRVEVVPGEPADWRRAGSGAHPALEDLLARVRAQAPDLALQLHGGGRESNHLVAALGARVTAGLATGDAPPLDRTLAYVYDQNEVLRYLEVVRLVGAPPVTLEPRLAVTDDDRAELAGVLDTSDRLVVLNPGAGDVRRRWPAACFAEVGDVLAQTGRQVVVAGGPGDEPLTRQVVAMSACAVDLAGRLSLGGLLGLLERADLVVSNDSGPLHLAVAVGTPTVGLYWPSNLSVAAPVLRARHRPVVAWRGTCPVCDADRVGVAATTRPGWSPGSRSRRSWRRRTRC
jgi:ADP-heptose:LPS heptosyltransferase